MAANEADGSDSPPAVLQEGEGDAELAALLTSALSDFDKQPAKKATANAAAAPGTRADKPPREEPKEPVFDPDMMREVDDMFKNMITQDPALKHHWDQLAESCNRAGESGQSAVSCRPHAGAACQLKEATRSSRSHCKRHSRR